MVHSSESSFGSKGAILATLVLSSFNFKTVECFKLPAISSIHVVKALILLKPKNTDKSMTKRTKIN